MTERKEVLLTSSESSFHLIIHVIPNAKHNEVIGYWGPDDSAIKIKLHSPALEGRANITLRKFLSEILDLPISTIEIVAGEKSRDKRVKIYGMDEVLAKRRLGLGRTN